MSRSGKSSQDLEWNNITAETQRNAYFWQGKSKENQLSVGDNLDIRGMCTSNSNKFTFLWMFAKSSIPVPKWRRKCGIITTQPSFTAPFSIALAEFQSQSATTTHSFLQGVFNLLTPATPPSTYLVHSTNSTNIFFCREKIWFCWTQFPVSPLKHLLETAFKRQKSSMPATPFPWVSLWEYRFKGNSTLVKLQQQCCESVL